MPKPSVKDDLNQSSVEKLRREFRWEHRTRRTVESRHRILMENYKIVVAELERLEMLVGGMILEKEQMIRQMKRIIEENLGLAHENEALKKKNAALRAALLKTESSAAAPSPIARLAGPALFPSPLSAASTMVGGR